MRALYILLPHFSNGVRALTSLIGPHSLSPPAHSPGAHLSPPRRPVLAPVDAAAWLVLSSPQSPAEPGPPAAHVPAQPSPSGGARCPGQGLPLVLPGCPAPGWAVGQAQAPSLWSQGATSLHSAMAGGDVNGVNSVACCKATGKEPSGNGAQLLLVFCPIFKQQA